MSRASWNKDIRKKATDSINLQSLQKIDQKKETQHYETSHQFFMYRNVSYCIYFSTFVYCKLLTRTDNETGRLWQSTLFKNINLAPNFTHNDSTLLPCAVENVQYILFTIVYCLYSNMPFSNPKIFSFISDKELTSHKYLNW